MAFLTEEEQKLDEAHGISVDEIRMWLERKGWNTGIGRVYSKRRNDGSFCYVATTNELSSALSDIAGEEGMNLQAVLREINPRMRPGYPSSEAMKEVAWWMFKHDSVKVEIMTSAELQIWMSSKTEVKYRPYFRPYCWPCDADGNKARWPVNAAGEML